MLRALLTTLVAVAGLAACGGPDRPAADVDPAQVDAVAPPQPGACRQLTPRDVARPTNATRTVDCHDPHTAETFEVGTLPSAPTRVGWASARWGAFARQACGDRFAAFLGADESLVMRTVLSWAWFRPSQRAWDRGARWYRCDVVGGQGTRRYVDLPTTARDLLAGDRPPDRWTVCADGPSVQTSPKIPCSRRHTWRAVTAIKVGDPGDPYPGDAAVEAKTRDYCSSYVGAWLGYPEAYDFGYTWFPAAEWRAGNRRSVCWARTAA